MHYVSFSLPYSVVLPRTKGQDAHDDLTAWIEVDPDFPATVELTTKDHKGKTLVRIELPVDALQDVVEAARRMMERNHGPLGCPKCGISTPETPPSPKCPTMP